MKSKTKTEIIWTCEGSIDCLDCNAKLTIPKTDLISENTHIYIWDKYGWDVEFDGLTACPRCVESWENAL